MSAKKSFLSHEVRGWTLNVKVDLRGLLGKLVRGETGAPPKPVLRRGGPKRFPVGTQPRSDPKTTRPRAPARARPPRSRAKGKGGPSAPPPPPSPQN